ncbi:MAG: hypothetical protein KAH44_05865 [Oricola sp.]|jgi:hypothetical protein|nr:hypothetical protein [Oricola sp.]
MTQLSDVEQQLFDEIVRAKRKLLDTARPYDEALKPIDEALEFLKSIEGWVDQLLEMLPAPPGGAPGAALDQQLACVLLGPTAADPTSALDELSIDLGRCFDISPAGVSAAVAAKCTDCSQAIADFAEAAGDTMQDVCGDLLNKIKELETTVVEGIEGAVEKLASAIENIGENDFQTPLTEASEAFDDLGEQLEEVRSAIITPVSKLREFIEKLLAIIDMIKALCVV